MAKGLINWGEVKKHQSLKDRWIVIDNKVYDVSSWQNRHPGGRKVIGHYAGQDATYAEKFLGAYYVGDLDQDCPEDKDINSKIKEYHEDLEGVRNILVQQPLTPLYTSIVSKVLNHPNPKALALDGGLFDGSKLFFGTMMLQIFVLESLAYLNLAYFGTSWWRIMLSVILYSISQCDRIGVPRVAFDDLGFSLLVTVVGESVGAVEIAGAFTHKIFEKVIQTDNILLLLFLQGQASWLQHDLGHLSVFGSTRINHIFHEIILGLTKGASCHWWNHMHSQHHAKPNVVSYILSQKLLQL
ncbi:unnamed protein product [Schistosoma curassoni]|uniref:Cytochrome b5 heme-binding domain-containing protein n=1 Tax=Schistosoma curassoni TaxID=6186 RepID=A0A183JCJ8_9TREM|nr:unnamed protein product [Schistosoma curassoni]